MVLNESSLIPYLDKLVVWKVPLGWGKTRWAWSYATLGYAGCIYSRSGGEPGIAVKVNGPLFTGAIADALAYAAGLVFKTLME
jgi:hypothetical protein